MKTPTFAVGTKNKIKIDAVGSVVKDFYPDAEVVGVDISSGVVSQPKTNTDTKNGAINRAKNALSTYSGASYGVGLESGVEFRDDGLWSFGWVAIVDQNDKLGLSKTIEFRLPQKIAELIKGGMEIFIKKTALTKVNIIDESRPRTSNGKKGKIL